MRLLITGATGFIGQALIQQLLQAPTATPDGWQLTILTRNIPKARQLFGEQADYLGNLDGLTSLADFDGIINLAGEPIGNGRWSAHRKQLICHSRWDLSQRLVTLFMANEQRPKVWLNASAIGYYGPQDSRPLDEHTPAGHDFPAHVCQRWESIVEQVAPHTRLCVIRIGLVLHPDGGALAKLLPPFKLGTGGPIGSGQQIMSWIHRADLVALLLFLLQHSEANGVFNGTAPQPVSNKIFVQALGQALRRPALVPVPSAAIKLMFGEMGSLLLTGQAALPRAALDAGFTFQYPDIQSTLQQLFKTQTS